jgi:hypothetical protein
MGYRGLEIQPQNMLADYAAVQQIQGGRQAQELNQLKMQEYERARTEEEGLRNYLAQSDLTKPETRAGLVRYGKTGLAYGKALTEQDTAALTQREAAFKVQEAKGKFIAQAKRDTSQNPSDANLTAFKEDLLANPLFTEVEKTQLGANVDRILAMPVGERRAFMASQGASASELKPTTNVGPTGIVQTPAFGGPATVVQGTEAAFQMTPAQIAANKVAQGQLAVSQGQLGVAQQRAALDVRKLAQDSDPAFVQKMAQAREAGVAAAKDLATATKVLPQVVSTANQTLSLIDTMIGKRDDKGNLVKGAAPHPGFEASVGATLTPGARFVPGSDASDFQSYFDQVKGGAFLQAFETLKGGGAITEKEGEKGTAALNRMNLAQSEKEFVTAAREFQSIVRAGVERAQAKVPGAAKPALSPIDQQALEWANSNPADPRAAAIKQRLGK